MASETSSTELDHGEWHRVSVFLSYDDEDFDQDEFLSVLDGDESDHDWLLWQGEGVDYHGHVVLRRSEELPAQRVSTTSSEPDEEAEPSLPLWSLNVRYYPDPLPEQYREEDWIETDRLTEALTEAVGTDEAFHPLYFVDLFFEVPPASWRFPLLADPPEMGDVETDLGTVSLGGLTLRFTDSPAGLWQASLETSPAEDEYYLALRFAEHLEPDSIGHLFRRGLNRAQTLAELFVNPGS